MYRQEFESPLGRLRLFANDRVLTQVLLPNQAETSAITSVLSCSALERAKSEFDRYFSGALDAFSTPYAFSGSSFQQRVWQALTSIAYGETVTYSDIAQLIGQPNAVRAVGKAIGANPLAIIVPCHRVIGRNGALTGFSGGIETKAWLLQHEAAQKPLLS